MSAPTRGTQVGGRGGGAVSLGVRTRTLVAAIMAAASAISLNQARRVF